MRSSIVFDQKSDPIQRASRLADFFYLCALAARTKEEPIAVTLQHSLRDDELTVLVETPFQSFSSTNQNPMRVFKSLDKALTDHLRQFNEHEEKQAKQRLAGKKSGGERGRKSSARKRSSAVPQGGRAQGR